MIGRGHRGRVDRNHAEIVKALRDFGCSAVSTSMVGRGFPDIVAGKHGKTHLFEVKDAKGELTTDEETFHAVWRGTKVHIVRSIEDALRVVRVP